MEFTKLILGIGILITFAWILYRNSKRTGILHSLSRIDTIIGVFAGLYLVVASIGSLLS
jgi:hypothetical protein